MEAAKRTPLVAIACGGTGGHFFPGLAIAEALQQAGCDIALLISAKEVDQEAIKAAGPMQVLVLPAVALQAGAFGKFLRGFWSSYRLCRAFFKKHPPRGVLAMGGFTSAAPVFAGNAAGAATFLHESNSIPGRANRWVSPWVDRAFVGYAAAARRLYHQDVKVTGTPVRTPFKIMDPGPCRISLGLAPDKPVLLVMGGSQGASGINELVRRSIPLLEQRAPELQFLHLAGGHDHEKLQAEYAAHRRRAVVRPFLTEMELALSAATVAISRAGASTLAEFAAVRVPAILIPYPFATDNHQFYNARALVQTGAARLLEQASATPEALAGSALELLESPARRESIRNALARWHSPKAAEQIAVMMLETMGLPKSNPVAAELGEEPPPLPARLLRPSLAASLKRELASLKNRTLASNNAQI